MVRVRYEDLDATRKGRLSRKCTLSRQAPGGYKLVLQAGDKLFAGTLKGPSGKLVLQYHEKLCSFLRSTYRAEVPGEVLATNAHEKGDREVRWSYAAGDPELRKKLLARIGEGRHVTFKGEGLELKEFREPLETPGGMVGVYGYREGGGRKRQKQPEKPDPAPEPEGNKKD